MITVHWCHREVFSRVFCVTNPGNLDCLDNLRQNACIWSREGQRRTKKDKEGQRRTKKDKEEQRREGGWNDAGNKG